MILVLHLLMFNILQLKISYKRQLMQEMIMWVNIIIVRYIYTYTCISIDSR